MIKILAALLITALVWFLCGALGLPYIVSIIFTVLVALACLGSA